MLEEWAWDPAVLRRFATNEAGEPIPAELVAKMRAADDFGKGLQARRQMAFAAISYHLHAAPSRRPHGGRAPSCAAATTSPNPIDGTHMHASFGHLEGYSSALLHVHVEPGHRQGPVLGIRPRRSARRRRRHGDIATRSSPPAGARDAADLVETFLGRPYNFDAFQRWIEA